MVAIKFILVCQHQVSANPRPPIHFKHNKKCWTQSSPATLSLKWIGGRGFAETDVDRQEWIWWLPSIPEGVPWEEQFASSFSSTMFEVMCVCLQILPENICFSWKEYWISLFWRVLTMSCGARKTKFFIQKRIIFFQKRILFIQTRIILFFLQIAVHVAKEKIWGMLISHQEYLRVNGRLFVLPIGDQSLHPSN